MPKCSVPGCAQPPSAGVTRRIEQPDGTVLRTVDRCPDHWPWILWSSPPADRVNTDYGVAYLRLHSRG